MFSELGYRRVRLPALLRVVLWVLLGLATVTVVLSILSLSWISHIPTSFAPILTDTALIKSAVAAVKTTADNIYAQTSNIYAIVVSIQDQVNQLLNPWDAGTFAPEAVLLDASYEYDQDFVFFPPDTVMAVGPDRIVVPANGYLNIYDKSTLQRVGHTGLIADMFHAPEIGATFADPDVIFDEGLQRFFVSGLAFWTSDSQVTIGTDGPFEAQSTSFGAVPPFSVSAEVVVASPLTGSPSLSNGASMPGKIALFERGIVPVSQKVKEAEQAGAVAAIVFNSVPGGGPPSFLAGCCLPITIPAVSVTYETGQMLLALIANGTTNVTIETLPEQVATNTIVFAVSKDASPSSVDDFYGYTYVTPENDTLDDYPKLAIQGESSVSLTFQVLDIAGEILFYSKVYYFSKAQLAAGPSGPIEPTDTAVVPGSDQHQFLYPSRPTPAPLADASMPMFFVGLDAGDEQAFSSNLVIYADGMPAYGLNPMDIRIVLPLPVETPVRTLCDVQQPLNSPALIEGGINIVTRPVVAGQSMWLVLNVCPTETQASLLWMRLDLSQFLPALSISVAEWGLLDLSQFGAGTSGIMPSIAVDAYGNVAISFTLVGPNVPATLAYTMRPFNQPDFSTDYQIAVTGGQYLYAQSYPPPDVPTQVRWGDYSALVVDPVDHRTFYAIGMYPSQSFFDNDGLYSYAWSVAVARFSFRPLAGPNSLASAASVRSFPTLEQRTLHVVRNPNIVNATMSSVGERPVYIV